MVGVTRSVTQKNAGGRMMMHRTHLTLAVLATAVCSSPAVAWGNEGHQAIALIARHYIDQSPAVAAKMDSILAGKNDPDIGNDFALLSSHAARAVHHERDADGSILAAEEGDIATPSVVVHDEAFTRQARDESSLVVCDADGHDDEIGRRRSETGRL